MKLCPIRLQNLAIFTTLYARLKKI
jgi:hypothetical protein